MQGICTLPLAVKIVSQRQRKSASLPLEPPSGYQIYFHVYWLIKYLLSSIVFICFTMRALNKLLLAEKYAELEQN